MTRSPGHPERGALFLLLLFLVLAVAMSRPVPLPPAAKGLAGLTAFLLLPGLALAATWPELRDRPAWARLALAWPLAMVLTAFSVLVGLLAGAALLTVAAFHLFGTFCLLYAGLVVARTKRTGGTQEAPDRIVWILLGAGVVLCLWGGAPSSPASDGPDHAAAVREIAATGSMFPRQGLVADGELDRWDPRKGTLHIGLGMAAAITGSPARDLWRLAPAVLALSFLALVYGMGRSFGESRVAGWLALGLTLLFLGGEGGRWTLRLGYGAHAAIVTAWAAAWLALDYVRSGGRSRLAMIPLLSAAAASIHAMGPGFLLAPWLGLAPMAAFRRGAEGRRWLAVFLVAVLGSLPIVVIRWVLAAGPANPLHVQTMPVLEWGRGLTSLYPPEAWRLLGPIGVLGILLLLLPAVRRSIRDPWSRGYIVAAALVPLGVCMVPGLFDATGRAASSFPIKLLYLAPYPWVLGVLLAGPWRGRGGLARAALAVALGIVAPGALLEFRPEVGRSGRPADAEELLAALRDIPGRVVVAADPWFSALVAAETQHYPITVPHQHGHPLDERGLLRLIGQQAVLSPKVALDERIRLLRRYRSAYLVVPGGNPAAVELGFGAARGGDVDRERRIDLIARSDTFLPMPPGSPGRIFRVLPEALATPPPPAPPARRDPSAPPGGAAIPPEDGRSGAILLARVVLPDTLRAGEANSVVLVWRRDGEGDGWPVEAHLRFRRMEDPPRCVLERRARLALGVDRAPRTWRTVRAPFDWAWPAARWPVQELLPDRTSLVPPAGLEPGRYVVSARVLPRPMFERVGIRDLLGERDRWDGSPIDTLEVLFVP